ncbi:hypothetical protein [Colwellia sp. MB02u-10]|nr:hypothetical protein [Colwellia sp. MB02u-10]
MKQDEVMMSILHLINLIKNQLSPIKNGWQWYLAMNFNAGYY